MSDVSNIVMREPVVVLVCVDGRDIVHRMMRMYDEVAVLPMGAGPARTRKTQAGAHEPPTRARCGSPVAGGEADGACEQDSECNETSQSLAISFRRSCPGRERELQTQRHLQGKRINLSHHIERLQSEAVQPKPGSQTHSRAFA